MSRIAARFAALRQKNRAALIAYVSAGDPDHETSKEIVCGLPDAGADLIELGMPFTDPMADGPSVQAAGLRALKGGATMEKTFAIARALRAKDDATPIVLMGYANSIHARGAERFAKEAREAGVDGLIIVDLPPEEDRQWRGFFRAEGLDLIRLATPTTSDARLSAVLDGAGGFLYYVSITGITGTKSFVAESVERDILRIKARTDLPIAVGFGIKNAVDAATIARIADAAVVGSAIVDRVAAGLDAGGRAKPGLAASVHSFVRELKSGVEEGRG